MNSDINYLDLVNYILNHRNNITLEEYEFINPLLDRPILDEHKARIEEITQTVKNRIGEQDSLRMTLGFDEVDNLFLMAWLSENKCLFQIKMTPETFEKLTADMIRVVKNYNLKQAEDYKAEQEKKNGEKESGTKEAADLVDSNEKDSGVEGSSVQPENIDQVHGGEAETVV